MIFGQKKKQRSKKRIWFSSGNDAFSDRDSKRPDTDKDKRVDYLFFKSGNPKVDSNKTYPKSY